MVLPYKIEEILFENLESVEKEYKEFIASDYFKKLSEKNQKIVELRLEVISLNISIFKKTVEPMGAIGEEDYETLLSDTFQAKNSLIKYQKTILESANV